MTQKVRLVELQLYSGSTPLVSSYLKAFASRDPNVRESFTFEIHNATVQQSAAEVQAALAKDPAEIYGISCYVWNMGLVKRVVRGLAAALPRSRFVLGGPQVIGQARRYLASDLPNVLICDGWMGEPVFGDLLLELSGGAPDLRRVGGLSFWIDGELVTTPRTSPTMRDLDEIPSPFLDGHLPKGTYVYTVFETNRGCPYSCAFCFWAGHRGVMPRFSDERIREELEWIARNRVLVVHVADSNWGLFERDVALTEHIARCKERWGFPYYVTFSTAKNHPERRLEICRILKRAGLINTQSLSLQSMSPVVLERMKRKNLDNQTYHAVQRALNEEQISTHVELVWPLPGETLESFKEGIDALAEMRIENFNVYATLVLNSTRLDVHRDEFGLVTSLESEGAGEAEIVTATAEVSAEQCIEGLWIVFALQTLYNSRCLYTLLHFLAQERGVPVSRVLDAFGAFCRESDFEPARQTAAAIEEGTHSRFASVGQRAHAVLSSLRDRFTCLLATFVEREGLIADEEAALVFEIDLLNRPYLFSNDVPSAPDHRLRQLEVVRQEPDHLVVRCDRPLAPLLERYVEKVAAVPAGEVPGGAGAEVRVRHSRKHKMPRMKCDTRASEDSAQNYVQGLVEHVRDIVPVWEIAS